MNSRFEILNADALLARRRQRPVLHDYGDDTLRDRFGQAVAYLRQRGNGRGGAARGGGGLPVAARPRGCSSFEDRKRYASPRKRSRGRCSRPASRVPARRCCMRCCPSIRTGARSGSGRSCIRRRHPAWQRRTIRGARAPMRTGERSCTKIPKWLISHPYNDMLGDGLPECERTWAFDFRVMTPTAWWRVPDGHEDRRPAHSMPVPSTGCTR